MSQSKYTSCSPFWLTNLFLSIYNGRNARCKHLINAEEEHSFQEWHTQQKNQFEETKEALDTAFKLRMAEQQREYASIQSILKLNLQKKQDEVRMFVKGWPLKLSLQAVQTARESQLTIPDALNILIATHTGGDVDLQSDPLIRIYDGNAGIVDHVQTQLASLGIPTQHVLRFEIGKNAGGAALANIYSMMSSFPSIVIMPRVDSINEKLIISLGYWYPNSRIPSQRKVFTIDYKADWMRENPSYRTEKQIEIETAYVAIAGVMNDVYALLTNSVSPRFPYCTTAKLVANKYPYIADLMRREYQAIIDCTQTTVYIDGIEYDAASLFFDNEKKEKIKKVINSILEYLN